MIKKRWLYGLLAAVFLLQSCATENKRGDAVTQRLGSYGVAVMRLGDQVVLTIPSTNLFEGYSVEISSSGQQILQGVLQLLKPMSNVTINIAAYAASPQQTEQDLFLTEKQAETVSSYLWNHHIDARLLTAVGYGGGHPVQYNNSQKNYRIEISLKDYVA